MNREEAHKLVDQLYDLQSKTEGTLSVGMSTPASSAPVEAPTEEAVVERVLPEGKRVVRTKSTGDRVYLLDEVQKTRRWVTSPEMLQAVGFEQVDVVEVDDSELLKYNMGPAIYKVD
jgi:hypothetical protein